MFNISDYGSDYIGCLSNNVFTKDKYTVPENVENMKILEDCKNIQW